MTALLILAEIADGQIVDADESTAQPIPEGYRFTVRSDPDLANSAGGGLVLRHGISYREISQIWLLGEEIESIVPVREITSGARQRDREVELKLAGTYPDLSRFLPLRPIQGRFLNDVDIKQLRNVVVLNQRAAAGLLDRDQSLPVPVFLQDDVYVVVGIVTDKSDAPRAWTPLTTMASRLGAMHIERQAGSFNATAFDVNQLHIAVRNPKDLTVSKRVRQFLNAGDVPRTISVSY